MYGNGTSTNTTSTCTPEVVASELKPNTEYLIAFGIALIMAIVAILALILHYLARRELLVQEYAFSEEIEAPPVKSKNVNTSPQKNNQIKDVGISSPFDYSLL